MFVQRVKPEDSLADGPEQLKKCREEINQAKQQITGEVEREGARAWDTTTSWMELSRPLAKALRGEHGVPKDASNAFFKGIELYNLVGPHLNSCGQTIRLFDNASLPGDFVRAMEWWAEHRATRVDGDKAPEVDWRANSLVGGLDDRFGLLRDHPERWMIHPATYAVPARKVLRGEAGKWEESDEPAGERVMTGDVCDPAVCDEMLRRLGDWRADIYTSDLGFAVQTYFTEEEEHFNAHSAQCFLGLRILRRGGVMIVKTFTMSTLKTMALVSHLMESFHEFYIVKPATSKADNSECYWVGINYRGPHHDPYGAREIFYPRALVQAQQLLAKRQAQKITQNVLQFRRRKCRPERQRADFDAAIKRWCAQHIGVRTNELPSPSAATAPTPQPEQ
jgi:hypothetical protein